MYRSTRACIFAAALLAASPVMAQAPAEFFAGKQITLLIGFGPGGTYDYYARLLARHMGKHIPGKPNIVPQHMPGAGSLTAANFLYGASPKDGTAMAALSQTLAIEEAIKNPGVKYKSVEMAWIGRATSIAQIQLSMATSKIKKIEDALVNEATAASTGAGSPTEGYPKLLNGVIKARFKTIGPYPGSVDGLLAMERGEVDTALTSYNTIKARRADWIREKKINILVTYSLQRHPELPDVPAFPEFGKTPEDRKLLEFYVSAEDVGRSFVAPPGLPADRVQTLRSAFMAMTKDADFLAEIKKVDAELNPLSGEELQKIIEATAAAPPSLVARMQAMLK
jgi:tripartite-type tricarboxylate transporter receptor subunit TctC